jgi:hypothetical protein
MCDKLVFDLSQEVEGSPNVFIRKDWINILDNQNQSYQNNQSIIDTSQLSNSNKYMSYREAYIAVPLLLTVTTPADPDCSLEPSAGGVGQADFGIGLKNWFGQIIHTFTLDYNGTTIIQQTPFCNMWNTFKLLTTLSYGDIITQGCTIGFYPDTSTSWLYQDVSTTPVTTTEPSSASFNGLFVCNNDLELIETTQSSNYAAIGQRYLCDASQSGTSGINMVTDTNTLAATSVASAIALGGNRGLTKRIQWINYNPNTATGSLTTYGELGVTAAACNQIWKSYISQQIDGDDAPVQCGLMQISVMATIYLKHIHAFFNMIPLLKGVFMKLTFNLNNASTAIVVSPFVAGTNPGVNAQVSSISSYSSTVPVGGVNPLHIPSFRTGSYNVQGGINVASGTVVFPVQAQQMQTAGTYWYNISVGARSLGINPNTGGLSSTLAQYEGVLAKSVYLYVPAYTFNPVFEQAYLSDPVKQIKYTDIYAYQVSNVPPSNPFNNLITNGIANIKSVLIIPFYSQNNQAASSDVQFQLPSPVYQSPFDPAGCGCTSPMITLGNFNVQISGQNAIYNTQRYTFEEFNNQLYGQFAVNGGLTDGLTSGLIGFEDFKQTYGYYYVNVERMLPVEQSVPKSVQILGTNFSTQTIDLFCFVEYGVEINIDLTTGARV